MVDSYDVVVIGGGVSGTATVYALTTCTNIKRIALIEKYDKLAQVNTHKDNNSQTLHFGDIETNYTAEKSRKVNAQTELTRKYVEKHKEKGLFTKSHKMVIAVGNSEVAELERRYKEIKSIYPKLRKIGPKEIAKLEPKVMEGRDKTEKIIALLSTDGYAVDYGKLAVSFLNHSGKHDVFMGMKVMHVRKEGKLLRIVNGKKTLLAKTIVVASGADSLLFAHKMNYAKHWILLPVAGSFYTAPKLLSGKVYTIQAKKLPFAAVHGDPDVGNPNETRFGPTAKVLPMMERHHYASIFDFLRLFRFRVDATVSLFNIIRDPILFKFILRNVVYDIPYIGTYYFMKQNVRKIIPTIKFSEIHFGNKLGGIRPQLVDTNKKSLEFGNAKVLGENIIFDITPSPGASVALANGMENAKIVAGFLKTPFHVEKMEKALE